MIIFKLVVIKKLVVIELYIRHVKKGKKNALEGENIDGQMNEYSKMERDSHI